MFGGLGVGGTTLAVQGQTGDGFWGGGVVASRVEGGVPQLMGRPGGSGIFAKAC